MEHLTADPQAEAHLVVAALREAVLRVVDHQAVVPLAVTVLRLEALRMVDLQAVVPLVVAALQAEAHPVVDLQEAHLAAVFRAVLQVGESQVVLLVAR